MHIGSISIKIIFKLYIRFKTSSIQVGLQYLKNWENWKISVMQPIGSITVCISEMLLKMTAGLLSAFQIFQVCQFSREQNITQISYWQLKFFQNNFDSYFCTL